MILDEIFLDGGTSQKAASRGSVRPLLAEALSGLSVMWVGVRCDPEVAAARERDRTDRVVGMARLQAERVHKEVVYDVVVETTSTGAAECASLIASHLAAVES